MEGTLLQNAVVRKQFVVLGDNITMSAEPRLRLAASSDVPAIVSLIEASVRRLQANDYSTSQIDAALGTVLGVDRQLIVDETYFVVEAGGDLVGCGGWSKRATLFGSDHHTTREDRVLDPHREPARIRAFFVHPDWARRGIGSRILEACETAAMAHGFRAFELGATLTGERLFRARGYKPVERVEVPLTNGESLPVIRMTKTTALAAEERT